MKNCKKCNEVLIEGKNWWASLKKRSIFTCDVCHSNRNKIRYENNKNSHSQKHQEWKKNNREKWLGIVKKYNKKSTEYRKVKNKELYNSLGSGIYGFKYNKKFIYIGESSTIYRRKSDHFTGAIKRSPISKLILEGRITKEELEFVILEQVKDKKERFERETYWINKYQPILNKSKLDVTKLI